MNLLILSRKRRLYSTRRLREECVALGHKPVIRDPLKCVLAITDGTPSMLYNGRALPEVHAAIPRVGSTGISYILAVLQHLKIMEVPLVNEPDAISNSKNKMACLQVLLQAGIQIPDTVLSRYPRHMSKLAKLVGGTPLIMKLLKGTHGTGIIYSDSLPSAESVLETIWSLGEDILLQESIEESKGRDLRVLVVGGRVVAAMRRFARPGDFRSNIHRGGVGEKVDPLDPEFERVALASAKAVGLRVAGVDILESDQGPLVIEVNASPGFQGLEEATGLNVARSIVEYAIGLAEKGHPASKTG